MSRLRVLGRSSVGKKAISAASGLVLVRRSCWCTCSANLQIFAGARAARRLRARAARRAGPALVGAGVLVVAFGVHVVVALQLARVQRAAARPWTIASGVRRARPAWRRARMLASGLLLAVFVLVHLAQPDLGHLAPALRAARGPRQRRARCSGSGPGAPFTWSPLARWRSHAAHGAWSAPQSLGLTPERGAPGLRRLARVAPHRRCGRACSRWSSRVPRGRCAVNAGARARRAHPGRSARVEVGHLQGQRAAGQPGQPPPLQRHRRRRRARGRLGRRRRWPSSATTSPASASRTARAARTASPRRAASTPPRTTRTTATA